MKKVPESAERVLALRKASGLDQKEFAGKLGVARSLVSACEAGKKLSVEMCVRLGNLAASRKRYSDADWFWEKAGIDGRAMLSASYERLKSQFEPSGKFSIPPTQKVPQGRDSLPLHFPASMISNPANTTYVRLSDVWYSPLFESGGLLVIDESETDFRRLQGACVAFYRSEEAATIEINSMPAKGRYIAELRAKGRPVPMGSTERTQMTRSGVFAAWLLGKEKNGEISVMVPSRFGPLLRDTVLGGDILGGDPIALGRVIAWIPDVRDSRAEPGGGEKK